MNFSANSILASILVSGIGFVFFEYGRRTSRPPQLVGGLALMVFPYFVSNLMAMCAVASALIAAVWFFVKFGW